MFFSLRQLNSKIDKKKSEFNCIQFKKIFIQVENPGIVQPYWPLMLAAAAPVNDVSNTHGWVGSSPGCCKILCIITLSRWMTVDFPEPAPP